MQIGGGITPDNAAEWLDAGASHVIVTSYIFQDGQLDEDRLQKMVRQPLLFTAQSRLKVIWQLSCPVCFIQLK